MNSTQLRVGIGHDTHRLEPGGPLILGGISVPHERHAAGHSDADVLLHAMVDALLGAASMGDIGELFPDTDPRHKGQNSAELVTTVPPDPGPGDRVLLQPLIRGGEAVGRESLEAARSRHREVRAELPVHALQLSRGYPAIPTVFSPDGD